MHKPTEPPIPTPAVAGTHLELLELHGAGHPAAAGAAGAGAPEASRGRSVAVELGREAWAALAARGGLPQLRFLMLAVGGTWERALGRHALRLERLDLGWHVRYLTHLPVTPLSTPRAAQVAVAPRVPPAP